MCSPTTTRSRKRARRFVADYLAAALNVPAARVHVEGHGSDEPSSAGKDAASLAANRRVDIVIEGARFEANAPLELQAAGGSADKVPTAGVVLRGPATAKALSVREPHAGDLADVVQRRGSDARYPLAHAGGGCDAANRRDQDRDPA